MGLWGWIAFFHSQSIAFLVNAGAYWVTLMVKGPTGLPRMIIKGMFGYTPSFAGFDAGPQSGCVPLQVQFTDTSHSYDPIVSYYWDFGDGTSSTQQHPLHTYTSTGMFDVTFMVTTLTGCTDTIHRNNYIMAGNLPPIVPFTTHQTGPCISDGLLLTVTNYSYYSSLYASLNIPLAQTYFMSGVPGCIQPQFEICNLGCCQTMGDTGIYCFQGIRVDYQSDFDSCDGAPVTINFTSPSHNYSSYLWDFGDGTTDTSANPAHYYPGPGNYIISLTVTDTNNVCFNGSVAYSHDIRVEPSFLQMVPDTGCLPVSVMFITDADPMAVFNWHFGDSGVAHIPFPSHTYYYPRRYYPWVETFFDGCWDTLYAPNPIVVGGVDYTIYASPYYGCLGYPVNYSAFIYSTLDSTPVSYTWGFGDGNTSVLPTPTHIYQAPGQYTISATLTDILGCNTQESRWHYITVADPLINFYATQTQGCNGEPINFVHQCVGTGLHFLWDFGDGTYSSLPNPPHIYQNGGASTVTLPHHR